MKVVDSSGWIEYVIDGALAKRFEPHLARKSELVVPSIVLYEVYKRLLRDAPEGVADAAAAEMGKAQIAAFDDQLALQSAEISLSYNLAMADAIVYATAVAYKATLVTGDADFKNLPNVLYYKKS